MWLVLRGGESLRAIRLEANRSLKEGAPMPRNSNHVSPTSKVEFASRAALCAAPLDASREIVLLSLIKQH
jgi:hypothetical protein